MTGQRGARYRPQSMDAGVASVLGHCAPCGKVIYPSRSAARQARKGRQGGMTGLSAFPCPVTPDGVEAWHLGHLPPGVRAGVSTRDHVRAAEAARIAAGRPRKPHE